VSSVHLTFGFLQSFALGLREAPLPARRSFQPAAATLAAALAAAWDAARDAAEKKLEPTKVSLIESAFDLLDRLIAA
jgi:hypothetical protein